MTSTLFLVTGAAGKTGAGVVEQLAAQGKSVRAMVRQVDERSARLESLGAEVVVGDLHDLTSIRSAVNGVDRIYFVYPPQGDRLLEATAIMAKAAADAGVEVVVNMSQISAREGAPSALSQQHWLGEQVLNWAPFGAVHIAANYFAENLHMFGAATIPTEGKLYLPYGDEKHAPVTADDLARVITAILLDPVDHIGQRYEITGPENMTVAEMASVLSEELSTPVEYVDLPVDMWGAVLMKNGSMNEWLVEHLKHVAVDHQNGIFNAQNELVERITGTPAQSLAEFARNNMAAFGVLANV
jgi:NAD(P)H dehydrogenase (quinone)